MRKKILVPVDFSTTAANAVKYAVDFAKANPGYDVWIVHIFMPQVDAEYSNFIAPMPEYTGYRKTMMEDFLISLGYAELNHDIWLGFPADEVLKRSTQYDLIIMGTTGEGGLMDKVLGSVSGAVALKASCPVLLIPAGAAYTPIHRVLYASHYDAIKPGALDSLLAINDILKATIHFVHVRDKQSASFIADKENIFSALFDKGEPSFSFELAEIDGRSVAESLNNYAVAHQIALIVVATHQRGFWEQLFHQSSTKSLLRLIDRPLMVLHLKA
jgi:nucleotide-binding universal stress UspA family protein